MSDPNEVLGQLLSPAQAATLDAAGRQVWTTAAAALESLHGAAPSLTGLDGRLVMPDEITGEFGRPHLTVPFELSTNQDQAATAYLVIETDPAAAYLESQADNPDDQEQQTIVIASTILGQVLQSLNNAVFGRSDAGLVVAIDDTTANSMPVILQALDDPCLLLRGTLSGAHELPLALVLPGTFLDIMAGAMESAIAVAAVDASLESPPATEAFSLGLTQEELEAAELLDMEIPSDSASSFAAPEPPPLPREPTPIGPAASRARFAPVGEAPAPTARSGIDLLAGLQMNVTVELGRTELTVSEVLGLGPGSVIELDRLAGEPVDILVNDRLIARGEVVVVDENFGIRVVEVVRRGVEQEERVG
ncbi:MAG: flagellar motor switch protein FliN [Chloroflexi bacterium]|nr:flagellar motor switch protein FliN [Chloroflexota bacterium]